MNKKLEDMIAESKLKEILHKNEAEKQKNAVVWVLAIIGAIAGIAAIAYAVFRFVTPDYLEDFEDDFDDDFDDYFDEDDQVKAVERLRKTAEQLSRQERDKSHDRGPER